MTHWKVFPVRYRYTRDYHPWYKLRKNVRVVDHVTDLVSSTKFSRTAEDRVGICLARRSPFDELQRSKVKGLDILFLLLRRDGHIDVLIFGIHVSGRVLRTVSHLRVICYRQYRQKFRLYDSTLICLGTKNRFSSYPVLPHRVS